MPLQFAREAIEIKTPRVLIRTGVPSDADAYARYATDSANFPHGGCESSMTRDAAAERIASFARWTAEGKHGWVLMFLRATGDFMGYGGYNGFAVVDAAEFLGDGAEKKKKKNKVLADMGIMLDRRFWGQGYGLEILMGLVEWARREVGAELFRTETELENGEWQALMERVQVGGGRRRATASYDEKKEVLQWRWDEGDWEEAKRRLQEKGRWVDIE